jgi:hypothetical protein
MYRMTHHRVPMREATPIERQQVLNLVFDRVRVVEKQLTAITPHLVFAHLIDAMTASCVGGVADGTRTRNNRFHRAALCH